MNIILLTNKLKILLLILVINTCVINANHNDYPKKWLHLLYYEKNKTGYKSLVETDTFFITKSGRENPHKEYQASLKKTLEQDLTFKTKFPLRYKWLAKHNKIDYKPTAKKQPVLDKVLVAYPNKHMSNPASMFGHLFLVLKTKRGRLNSNILHYIAVYCITLHYMCI